MSFLAWIGNRGSAPGPTASTSSSGASSSAVPAAKKSPGRRTMLNNAARSAVIMDMKPAGETLMGEVDGMASVPPRLPRAPTHALTPCCAALTAPEVYVRHRHVFPFLASSATSSVGARRPALFKAPFKLEFGRLG